MARQKREERRQADRAARRLRSDEGWLERHTEVFSEHGSALRIPPGILNLSDNYELNSVDSDAVASGSTDVERAIDAPHQKDNSTINRIIATDAVDDRTIRASAIRDHHINNRLGKTVLPADTHFGKVKARAGGADDMDWGDRSIPKRALPPLTAADVNAATRQQVSNLSEQVRLLKQKVNAMGGRE